MTSTLLDLKPTNANSLRKVSGGRRWLQFSLRTFLVLLLVVSVPLAWGSQIFRRAQLQQAAVAELGNLGGNAMECHLLTIDDYWSDRCPDWLKDRLADDFFQTINYVSLHGPEVTDKNLVCLKALPQIQSLTLTETNVTDAGLVAISQLPHLNSLNLRSTAITDAGLRSLQNLTKLTSLELSKTKITDAGLIHLHLLKTLKNVDLKKTQVTDAGVESLKQAIPGLKVDR